MTDRPKVNVLIHGEPKVGKTTFAVKRNPKALILDTEGSSKLIRGINRHEVKSMRDMDEVLGRIKSGEVNVVVIDTIDELVNNFGKAEALAKSSDYVNKAGMLTMQGWGYMRDRFLAITRAYRDAGADVLTICHSELIELPNGKKKWTMKLPSNYAKEVMGLMDAIGFMEVVTSPDGNRHVTHFDKTGMYDAGIRAIYDAVSDTSLTVMPEEVENLCLVDMLDAYDKFYSGEGKGYMPNCQNCKRKGDSVPSVGKALTPSGNEEDLCEPCTKRCEEAGKKTKK
jgi:hypothetical protein